MRPLRTLLASVPWLVCAALGALCVPIATGRWEPAWLRVPPPPRAVERTASLSVPGIEAAFRVEQRALTGELLWRLEGERVVSRSFEAHDLVRPRLILYRDGAPWASATAESGRVRLPEGDEVWARLDLAGDVVLARGPLTCRTEALEVWVDRRLERDAEAPARPGADGGDPRPATAGVRVVAPGRVVVERSAGPEGAAAAGFVLRAAGLEGTLEPLTLDVDGPVDVAAGPFGAGPLAGRRVTGEVRDGARLRALDEAGGPRRAPDALELVLRGVDLRAGPDGSRLAARRLALTWARTPAAARAALGGLAGAGPRLLEVHVGGAAYALRTVAARGEVAGRWVAPAAGPDAPARDLALAADTARGSAWPGPARLVARGAPARLADLAGGAAIAAARLAVERGADLELAAEGGVDLALPGWPAAAAGAPDPPPWRVRAQALAVRLAEPERGAPGLAQVEGLHAAGAPVALERADGVTRLGADAIRYAADGSTGRLTVTHLAGAVGPDLTDGAPWTVDAERLTATVRRAGLARLDARAPGEPAPDWRELLAAAAAEGAPAGCVRAEGPQRDPDDHRGLAAERLAWREGEPVTARGRAALALGRSRLAAERLDYDPDTGLLEAAGGLDFQTAIPHAGAALPLAITAARGRARLAPDPAAWEASRAARRAARRRGIRSLPPPVLRGLELEGGPERIALSGPRGLEVRGDRFRYDAERRVASLAAADGGPPLELAAEGGRARARRAAVWLVARWPRPSYWAALAGDVSVALDPGALADDASDPSRAGGLALRAGWLLAEVAEPPPGLEVVPLGPFAAGGPEGVAVRSTPPAEPRAGTPAPELALDADHVAGVGWREELRVEDADGLRLRRGDAELRTTRARLRLLDDRRAARVVLEAPWTATFPLEPGRVAEARGGRAALELDVAAARAGRRPDEPEAELARRLLRRVEAEGGVALDAPGLTARADAVALDRDAGVYTLTGEPAEVVREGLRSRGHRLTLRLEDR